MFEHAKYIKARECAADFSLRDSAPLFRKEINIDRDVGGAKLSVQAPGFAVFYINGNPITEDRFISPVSDYRKILWYNTYDVTALLKKGKNTLCAIAGNGFFNESFESAWHFQRAPWRDEPRLLVSLEVNGKTAVASDESWKCSRECSPIIYNHLRSGEYFDARKDDNSWLFADYDDSNWQNAIEADVPLGAELRPINCQPVRECERILPVRLEKTADGYLADFGVTLSGYIEITLTAARDKEINFFYAEELDSEGRPKHNEMDQKYFYAESPFMLDKLIASGNRDHFKPHFAYHGFRYVLIEGAVTEVLEICAHFVHQDVARISEFCSGNEVLNFIYNAGLRSTYSNMFWALTDCPTREKLGWANDAQASVEQTLINFDVIPLFEKWFEDLKSSMRDDGALPGIIPSPDWGFRYGPVCDCFLYELPYRIYLYTGNAKMLVDAIPYFEKYLVYVRERPLTEKSFILGDWTGGGSSERIPKEFVLDFYMIKAMRITALARNLAGMDDHDIQSRLASAERDFIEKYTDDRGNCTVDEQAALAIMLENGLNKNSDVLSKQLIEVVIRDGLRLTCGMVGVQYLYGALTKAGRADLAYRMITESEPGYKTWYEAGATTLWERWDGKDAGSHNHHMFSGVIAWFFKALLGIAPKEDAPAFEEIELKPCFIREAGFVKGYEETARGRIEAEWKYENGGFSYTVSIPDRVRAIYNGHILKSGKNNFFVNEDRYENNRKDVSKSARSL